MATGWRHSSRSVRVTEGMAPAADTAPAWQVVDTARSPRNLLLTRVVRA